MIVSVTGHRRSRASAVVFTNRARSDPDRQDLISIKRTSFRSEWTYPLPIAAQRGACMSIWISAAVNARLKTWGSSIVPRKLKLSGNPVRCPMLTL
jgi:hypothetical protein